MCLPFCFQGVCAACLFLFVLFALANKQSLHCDRLARIFRTLPNVVNVNTLSVSARCSSLFVGTH
eukprot:m.171818 g.171818  ORF g.171818 m.171818 type:complete len:65 (-) comp17848_c0_seq7:1990-2184(-)